MDLSPERTGTVAEGSPAPQPALERERVVLARLNVHLNQARARVVRRGYLRLAEIGLRLLVGSTLVLALCAAFVPALDLRVLAPLALTAILTGLYHAGAEMKRYTDGVEVARYLARTRPRLADELHSLVELGAAERSGRLTEGTAFLLLLRERVAEGFDQAPLTELIPYGGALRALRLTLLLCSGGLSVVHLLAPRLLPNAYQAVRHGPPRDVSVPNAPPIVGDLELELRPPAYTGLPPRVIPASSGDLRALRGTEVSVRGRSLVGAVRDAKLRLELDASPWQTVQAEIERKGKGPPLVSAKFTVDGQGRYRFMLSRWTGKSIEPEGHRIEVDADLAPRVELRAPADPLELDAPRPVELGLDLEDDYGLGEISLVYRIGEQPEQRLPITVERPTPRRGRGVYLWETVMLERDRPLPPGAKISYWVEGRDNDAVSGPKTGRSRVYTLVLRGKADPSAIDRASLEGLLEGTIAALADRLEGSGSEPSRHEALVALAAKFTSVARPAKETSATLALQRLAGEISLRLTRLANEEAGPSGPKAVAEKIVGELERDVLALDDLRGRRRLEEMARIGTEMKQLRDDLKRLFDELKSATSEAHRAELKREIERKLMELEARMAELRRVASDAEGEVPDEFLNREAIGKQDVGKGVESIRDMLARGDLDKAMSELDRMSRSLDRLTSQLDRGRDEQRASADPAAEQALGQLESDLADLARDEREIEKEARAIRDRAAARGGASPESLKALRDKLRPKITELQRRADEQAKDGHLADREELERLKSRARGIDRALESNDLDEAQQMALDTRRIAGGVSRGLSMQMEQEEQMAQARVGDGASPQLRRGAERMARTEDLAKQVEAELQRAEASRSGSLDEGDRRKLEELSRRQQQAQQRGDSMMKRMAQQDQPGMSSVPEQARRGVEQAREAIGDSGRMMQHQAPGRGADRAGEAAKLLDSAREQVGKARRGGEDGEQPQQNRDERVRIPGADDSKSPDAFRKDILDAAKRGAPKRFEEPVQRYYEELVR